MGSTSFYEIMSCIDFDSWFFLIGIFIIVYLFASETFKIYCTESSKCTAGSLFYDYGKLHGPHTWKYNFPNACGECQSPINLITFVSLCKHSEALECPLTFSNEYYFPPPKMVLENDGHTVNLQVIWGSCKPATITGGPLEEDVFQFHNFRFCWGPTDEDGTEHMIDYKKYALELQATFWNKDSFDNVCSAIQSGEVVIVAYVFQTTPVDNPYLEVFMNHLCLSNEWFSNSSIESMPLSFLAPPFSANYFSYRGSLTYPPCTEGVRWIIQPEPLLISYRQMMRIRKTRMPHCTLQANTRPVQDLNGRDIIFYN